MQSPEGKETVVQYDNVRLKDVGGGRLSLSSSSLIFEKISGIFSKKLTVERMIPLSSIIMIKSEGSNMIVEWEKDDRSKPLEVFNFGSESLANQVSARINGAVQDVRQQLEKEERKKRNLIRYRQLIWDTATKIWSISLGLYDMISLLKDQDWDMIDSRILQVKDQMASLSRQVTVNVTLPVQELVQAASRRDGEQIKIKASEVVKILGEGLKGRLPVELSGEDFLMQLTPGWDHLKHFFLFAARYNEVRMSSILGTSEQAKSSISRLTGLSVVLRETFGLDVVSKITELEKDVEASPTTVLTKLSALAEYIEKFLEENVKKASAS